MARISIQSDYTPVEVDLWGVEFESKPMTRTLSKEWGDLLKKAFDAEDDDEAIERVGAALDARLKPAGQGRKKPSVVIVEKWKAEALTVPQLFAFLNSLTESDSPN